MLTEASRLSCQKSIDYLKNLVFLQPHYLTLTVKVQMVPIFHSRSVYTFMFEIYNLNILTWKPGHLSHPDSLHFINTYGIESKEVCT